MVISLPPSVPPSVPPSLPPSLPSIQVSNLQKKASDLHELLTRMSTQAEQVVAGKMTSQAYAKEEDASRKRLHQLTNEAESLVQSL